MFYLCKKNNMIYLEKIFEKKDNDDISEREREFVAKEYESKTYRTCLACGDLIFK